MRVRENRVLLRDNQLFLLLDKVKSLNKVAPVLRHQVELGRVLEEPLQIRRA